MADEFDENDFEEDFQEADEPDEPEDLDAAEGDQEQIDILPAGKVQIFWEGHKIYKKIPIMFDTYLFDMSKKFGSYSTVLGIKTFTEN